MFKDKKNMLVDSNNNKEKLIELLQIMKVF